MRRKNRCLACSEDAELEKKETREYADVEEKTFSILGEFNDGSLVSKTKYFLSLYVVPLNFFDCTSTHIVPPMVSHNLNSSR